MSIDLSTERLVSLTEAAALLPGRPHLATLWRWCTRGVRGRRLESLEIGGRRYTSLEALQRFSQPHGASPPPATAPSRESQLAQAEQYLAGIGVARNPAAKEQR